MGTESADHGNGLLAKGARILSHLAVAAIGFVLMVIGLGLGVTLIMLPVGLIVGLIGVGLFVWGIVGHRSS